MRPATGDGGGGTTTALPEVVLYSRPGCHLCDVAREAVLALRTRIDFEFEEVDIERDDALELEYGIRIPVVTVDGEERFEVTVDPGELARLLREPGGEARS